MDIKYGGVSSDFYVHVGAVAESLVRPRDGFEGGPVVPGICLAMVGQARVPYSLYRTES